MSIDSTTHKGIAGIRDAGSSSIRNKGNRFPLLKQIFKTLSCLLLIMFMKGYLRLGNIEMFEQQTCLARIFTSNKIDFTECCKRTQCDVVEISNRSGNQVEHDRPFLTDKKFIKLALRFYFAFHALQPLEYLGAFYFESMRA